jgi:hypothetical protein
MPHDSNSNAPSSGRTSASAQATRPTDPTGEKKAAEIGESAFLTRQAADAKRAISRVVDDLKNELSTSVDPRAWMQVHPWTTMGAAAVAGFLAAAVAIPSKEQQALKRLAEIEKALMPRHRANGYPDDAEVNGNSVRKAGQGGSFLAGLASQVLHAVQPVLMSAITAGVTAKSVEPEPPQPSPAAGDGYQSQPQSPAPTGGDPSI